MTEHQVVVVFDVTAETRELAAMAVAGVLSDDGIESWWFPQADLRHVDRNDNGAMHLEPDDPPHDVFVEDDAEDEPTIWLHDHCEPDSPLPLLRRVDVASVWPGMPQDRRDLTYAAGDVLWKHIVRGLPTSPPAATS